MLAVQCQSGQNQVQSQIRRLNAPASQLPSTGAVKGGIGPMFAAMRARYDVGFACGFACVNCVEFYCSTRPHCTAQDLRCADDFEHDDLKNAYFENAEFHRVSANMLKSCKQIDAFKLS
jgi:hypothetical protein